MNCKNCGHNFDRDGVGTVLMTGYHGEPKSFLMCPICHDPIQTGPFFETFQTFPLIEFVAIQDGLHNKIVIYEDFDPITMKLA